MKHIYLDQCQSTQSSFKNFWQDREPQIKHLLVSCKNQLAGYGRRQNSWVSGKNCLAMSCSLDRPKTLTLMPLNIAVGVIQFLEKYNRQIFLKWPNDLLNSQQEKIGGILCQTLDEHHILAGIGLNLFLTTEEISQIHSDYPVNHLSLKDIDRKIFAENLYQHLLDLEEFSAESWNLKCLHLNKTVIITDSENSFEGKFIGIDEYGAAILETNEGTIKVLTGQLRVTN